MDPKLPIRSLDYTVIFARQMATMREFYERTLDFPLHRQLGPKWLEFRVGSNILALTQRGLAFDDPSPPIGVLRCWRSTQRSNEATFTATSSCPRYPHSAGASTPRPPASAYRC
jgi:hypothetical protein